MALYKSKFLFVDKSPVHGYGLFTSGFIKKSELIEECNVFLLKPSDYASDLFFLSFQSPERQNNFFIPCGYCVTINSSNVPNVYYEFDKNNILRILAVRDIGAGEELFLKYPIIQSSETTS